MFIIFAVSMIPQIKNLRDGITTDKHVIMLFHAYLPSTCMCLALVCRQLFLPGSDLQINNKGQTEFYVSTPKVSRIKFLPLSTELQVLAFWCPCRHTVRSFLHLHCWFPTFGFEKAGQGEIKMGGLNKQTNK